MTRIATLRNLILKAKHAYYYSNEPVMSDAEYDALEDELRLIDANDPVLALVGSPVPANTILTKARHSIPMGSQSKVNSEDEFRTWCAKNEVKAIHASLKGDGASAAAYYRDGQLVQAISRGDGAIGEDITANALRFKGLPAWIGTQDSSFSGAVRFEVILTVDDWTKIDPARSKNPRNAGNGIMGRKNGHQSDCLTIFAFDLDEMQDGRSVEFQTESEKSARLAELGFNVIQHSVFEVVDDAIDYFKSVGATRESLPIWIDGVVMKVDDIAKQRELGSTAGRPKGQIAWKFDSSGSETVLEGVVVSGGHTGGLYPTAQLRPVDIGGTTVSNASLANYDEIERLDVAIGDSVWVVKANDIIPKIIRVTERAATRQPIPVPTACPFCGGEVGRRRTTGGEDGVIIECRNGECPKKSTGKIRRWIASLDILGIGDVVLESMIERFDLADAADLYTLRTRASELADLVTHAERDLRLGEKRTASILDAIDATRALTLSQFLGSLGLEHLGKRRVELMIKSANGLLDRLEDWRSGLLRDPANAVKAGVPNIGGAIQDGIDAMSTVIDKLLAAGVTAAPHTRTTDTDSARETASLPSICISGKLPSGKKKSDYEQPLQVAGYELVEDVTKGLNYLVLADPASNSSKAEKARKLGVTVISEEQLTEMVTSVPQQVPVVQKAIQTVEEIPMSSTSAGFKFDGQFQRFEFVDEKSSKFWEIRVEGACVEVRYGKIGTAGQNQTKEFGDESAAQSHAEKLALEKSKKGYLQVGVANVLQSESSGGKKGTPGSDNFPKEFIAIRKLWVDIASSLTRVASNESKELIELYEGRLSAGCFGFDPVLSPLEPTQLDRLGNVLRGPVYTCEGYEWPVQSGYPMVPFIQLDLEYCGRVGSVDLGSGLLQAFMGHGKISPSDALIRVVPRTSVVRERLLPMPNFDSGINAFSDICWATQTYDADDEDCQALQIVKFSPPRFGIPRIEKLREFDDLKSLRALGLTEMQVKEFDNLAESLAKKYQPTAFHLFGSFSPIQYGVSERPMVLFNFSSEQYGFNFGDGNGQLFFEKLDSGAMRFSFDWSCS